MPLLIILGGGFVFALSLVSVGRLGRSSQPQDDLTAAAILTRRAADSYERYKNASLSQQTVKQRELSRFLEQRKTHVLRIIKTDPASLPSIALSEEMRANLPGSLQALVEQPVHLPGTFRRTHGHDGSGRIVWEENLLETADGRSSQVYSADTESMPDAAEVTIDGIALDGNVAVPTTDSVTTIAPAKTPTPLTTGPRNVLVLLFTYQDFTPPSTLVTANRIATLREQIFTNANSTKALHEANSFNQVTLTSKLRADGDIYGYFQIPQNHTPCNWGTWIGAVNQAATNSGIDISGYDHYVYVSDVNLDCGVTVTSATGGNTVHSNGIWSALAYAHEIGHNLGAYHARVWDCRSGPTRVPISANCVYDTQYYDPFDFMGGGAAHMNTYHKAQLGLYQSDNILEITTAGTHTIVPVEQAPGPGAPSQTQALVIPRGTLNSIVDFPEYFYVELRAPGDIFSPPSSSPVYDGISIRVAPHYTEANASNLIDITPLDPPADSSLRVGQTLLDPVSGIALTLENLVRGVSATVRIDYTCVHRTPGIVNPPGGIGSNIFYVRPGVSFPLTFDVTNNDTEACTPHDFSFSSALPAGWSQTPPPTLAIPPSTTATAATTVTVPVGTADGRNNVMNTFSVSSDHSPSIFWVYIYVDGTSPSLALTAPDDGSTLPRSGTMTISVQPADNNNTRLRTQLSIDGAVVQECYQYGYEAQCSYDWNVDKVSTGNHIIRAVVTDAAGNSREETRTVLRPLPPPRRSPSDVAP